MRGFLRSMTGRVFVLLVAGVVSSALIMHFLAQRQEHALLEQLMLERGAERISDAVLQLDRLGPGDRNTFADQIRPFGVAISFASDAAIAGDPDPAFETVLNKRIAGTAKLRGRVTVPYACAPSPGDRHRESRRRQVPSCRVAYFALTDGTPVQIRFRGYLRRPPPRPKLIFRAGFLGLLGLLAYVISRIATRPLRALATAADALGHDLEQPPLPVSGPTEVQRATIAFNAMVARIRHHVDERIYMLAAIAHDLQTPLTRLRLRLEKVPDAQLREKLVADLAHMQTTITDGLEFVRSMAAPESLQSVDLDSLLDSVCSDAGDTGADVTLSGALGIVLKARPNAIRRCLTNLLDNAVKYGGYARVTVTRRADTAVITITDGGAGIPAAQLEAVFAPFYRVETSRSRDTGGTGLGLTIARNLIEQNGGALRLRNLPEGGLEATLELPVGNLRQTLRDLS
ncbi:MAG: HAMP domain-containing protein [Gammaproteobacteria bacterium]|nr:HAMP domain-containing protein [Gammaproteobacteria bacterium]